MAWKKKSFGFFADCYAYTNYIDKIVCYSTDIKNKSFSCIHISQMDNHKSSYILDFIRNVSERQKNTMIQRHACHCYNKDGTK